MYKLLLVSDREDVLNAFGEVGNWERLGFKAPHIRHDFEGAKDSLAKHHADGISIALDQEEKEKLITYLREEFPYLPVFKAGTTREEVVRYLHELKTVLNRLRADFSSDEFSEKEVMLECRHDMLRHLVSGEMKDEKKMCRMMRLLRSRMDGDRPCILIELKQDGGRDTLDGRWHDSYQLLERTLYKSFARDINGYHILPLVTEKGKIFVLAGPLHGQESNGDVNSITPVIKTCTEDGIEHVRHYQGLNLRVDSLEVFPSLKSLCN